MDFPSPASDIFMYNNNNNIQGNLI